MSAEEAMKQVDQIMDDYCESRISQLRALSRIAQVVGHHRMSAEAQPVEWGTSTFPEGTAAFVKPNTSEESARWRQKHRNEFVFRRPVPAAWERVL